MKKVEGNTGVRLLECINPIKNKWRVRCKMAYQPGVSGKIFAKLGENGVNIRMITQGPEELNIIVGVEEKDFEQAIRVLYNSFVKENVV